MKKDDFFAAIQIIMKHPDTHLAINQPVNDFVGPLGSTEWSIHIQKCTPKVISELTGAGFSLSMSELGINVIKI